MKLITHLKNGSSIVTQLSPSVTKGQGKYNLTPKQINKKMYISARAIAGLEYERHKVIA